MDGDDHMSQAETPGSAADSPLLIQKELDIVWDDSAIPSPQMANMVAVQLTPDGVILTFGLATPPLLVGNAKQQQAAVDALHEVTAHAHSKVILSPARFQEFMVAMAKTTAALIENGVLDPTGGEVQQ